MALSVKRIKYFVYGLFAILLLTPLCLESNAKILFCKNCRTTRNHRDTGTTNTTVDTAYILDAPSKCRTGYVPDRRGNCRKLVFNN